MNYIKLKDEELAKSITLMVNISLSSEKKSRILEQLKSHYENNPESIEAIFSYGFFNHLLIVKDFKSKMQVDEENLKLTLDCYNEAIHIAPDYWLVYLFKGILLMTLPEIAQDSDELQKTIDRMFELQRVSVTQYNYFLIPYIMAADYFMANNDMNTARSYIEKSELLGNIQRVEFECLDKHFREILEGFEHRLIHSQESILIDVIVGFREHFY